MTRPAAGTVIQVPVTSDHIDRGHPEDACEREVALAVIDAIHSNGMLPAIDSVSVMYDDDGEGADARVWIAPGAWLRLVLGADCAQLMRAIDAGQPAEPCTLLAEVA